MGGQKTVSTANLKSRRRNPGRHSHLEPTLASPEIGAGLGFYKILLPFVRALAQYEKALLGDFPSSWENPTFVACPYTANQTVTGEQWNDTIWVIQVDPVAFHRSANHWRAVKASARCHQPREMRQWISSAAPTGIHRDGLVGSVVPRHPTRQALASFLTVPVRVGDQASGLEHSLPLSSAKAAGSRPLIESRGLLVTLHDLSTPYAAYLQYPKAQTRLADPSRLSMPPMPLATGPGKLRSGTPLVACFARPIPRRDTAKGDSSTLPTPDHNTPGCEARTIYAFQYPAAPLVIAPPVPILSTPNAETSFYLL
ncbi:hypothetical protein C8J57DRAFT_1459612 [Mycena rebaudengoi]|nr:hypothetical protein C8J57DRAFT_1459612 [Mycena rebaudengoi]